MSLVIYLIAHIHNYKNALAAHLASWMLFATVCCVVYAGLLKIHCLGSHAGGCVKGV